MKLIDADALYEKFKNGKSDTEEERDFNQVVRYLIRQAPIIEAVPVVRGKWTRVRKWWQGGSLWVMCSECEKLNASTTNFCPHCGCDMRGDTP